MCKCKILVKRMNDGTSKLYEYMKYIKIKITISNYPNIQSFPH